MNGLKNYLCIKNMCDIPLTVYLHKLVKKEQVVLIGTTIRIH